MGLRESFTPGYNNSIPPELTSWSHWEEFTWKKKEKRTHWETRGKTREIGKTYKERLINRNSGEEKKEQRNKKEKKRITLSGKKDDLERNNQLII